MSPVRDRGRQNLVPVVVDRVSRVDRVSVYRLSIAGLFPVYLLSIFRLSFDYLLTISCRWPVDGRSAGRRSAVAAPADRKADEAHGKANKSQ